MQSFKFLPSLFVSKKTTLVGPCFIYYVQRIYTLEETISFNAIMHIFCSHKSLVQGGTFCNRTFALFIVISFCLGRERKNNGFQIIQIKNVIYCINKLKKNHTMILTYAGKIFDKILSANQG